VGRSEKASGFKTLSRKYWEKGGMERMPRSNELQITGEHPTILHGYNGGFLSIAIVAVGRVG